MRILCAILGLRSFGDFATEEVFEAVGFLSLIHKDASILKTIDWQVHNWMPKGEGLSSCLLSLGVMVKTGKMKRGLDLYICWIFLRHWLKWESEKGLWTLPTPPRSKSCVCVKYKKNVNMRYEGVQI